MERLEHATGDPFSVQVLRLLEENRGSGADVVGVVVVGSVVVVVLVLA